MSETNKIFCSHFKETMPALDKAPIVGPLGQVLLKHVSKEAWNEWLEIQMKIINEERLDLSEETSQKRLYQQMINYLGLNDLIDIG